MRGRLARDGVLALAACLVAVGCSSRGGPRAGEAGGEPGLRIWVSPILRWGDGADRDVEFGIENATYRTIAIATPDPAYASVAVLHGPESRRVCGVVASGQGTAVGRVELAPGDRVAVRVDLARACGAVAPGEYRFELDYRAPEPPRDGEGEARAWSGPLATSFGQVFVAPGGPEPAASAGAEAQGEPTSSGPRAGRRTPGARPSREHDGAP